MEPWLHLETWLSLLTLTAMEIVLGIDNIVFLSILTGRLPLHQRPKARRLGLIGALGTRLLLLLALNWLMGLTTPIVHLFGRGFSGRDVILGGGGLFLIGKATHEIHGRLDAAEAGDEGGGKRAPNLVVVLVQIALLDVVFSLDSVITAVGMAPQLAVMVAAMFLAVGVMMVFAGAVSDFITRHPTMKMLALSFLLLIGVLLCAEAMGQHVDKAMIYFAMGFSFAVEMLNLRSRKHKPVALHNTPDMPPEA
jgi:predicted tellurium resistance membrane protein TerC